MRYTVNNKCTTAAINSCDVVCIPVTVTGAAFKAEQLAFVGKVNQKAIEEIVRLKHVGPNKPFLMKSLNSKTFFMLFAEKEWTEKRVILAVRRFIRTAKSEGFTHAGVVTDGFWLKDTSRIIESIVENAELAHFDFAEEFKTKPKDGWKKVQRITLFTSLSGAAVKEAVRVGELTAKWVNRSRILCNYPPSHMKPEGFAEAARTIEREVPALSVEIFDELRLAREGMNAILSVGQGSEAKPRLVIVEYKGVAGAPIALIGKGITFDSGGLNTKGNQMDDMHMDMSGAAGVLCSMALMAELKLPVHVVGVLPVAENMPSGISYRQGDIITAYGGKTIEVGNTDAEGRVVMADAIEYAKTKKPKLIMTLATLTGASLYALGLRLSALIVKDNEQLQNVLKQIGEVSHDPVWPLPLMEEDEREVEGHLADVINTAKSNTRFGQTQLGAAFLAHFAKPVAFAHIDMAPRMKTLPNEEHLSAGSAGYGVRYFTELARQWSSVQKFIP